MTSTDNNRQAADSGKQATGSVVTPPTDNNQQSANTRKRPAEGTPTKKNDPKDSNEISLRDPFQELRDPRKKIGHLRLYMGSVATAQLVWDNMLTPSEREQLGGDFKNCINKYKSALAVWQKVRPMSDDRAIVKISYGTELISKGVYRWLLDDVNGRELKLTTSRRKGLKPIDPEYDPIEQIENAVNDHRLVLVEGSGFRRVYWEGTRVEQDWTKHEKSWELLKELARQAKKQRGVDRHNLNGAYGDRTIVPRRSRLKKLIPANLDDLIASMGRGEYKLQMPRTDICVLELEADQFDLDDE